MPVPDMKLGNSLAAMGVGAYFLKVFLWRGKLSGRSVLRSVSKLACSEERAQVTIFNVCNE